MLQLFTLLSSGPDDLYIRRENRSLKLNVEQTPDPMKSRSYTGSKVSATIDHYPTTYAFSESPLIAFLQLIHHFFIYTPIAAAAYLFNALRPLDVFCGVAVIQVMSCLIGFAGMFVSLIG
jgi:hypothetical protein